jgi:hypothetical protein
MTKKPGDWPDPQNQGYPKNPMESWWHGLRFESGEIYCFWWRGSMWEHGNERYSPEMIAKMGVQYIGPCILQEETTAPLRDALRQIRDQEPERQAWSVGVARNALEGKETTND